MSNYYLRIPFRSPLSLLRGVFGFSLITLITLFTLFTLFSKPLHGRGVPRHQFFQEVMRIFAFNPSKDFKTPQKQFPIDLPLDHTSAPFINQALKMGLLKGYPDGKIHPFIEVKIDAAVIFISRILKIKFPREKSSKSFPNLPLGHWLTPYLKRAGRFFEVSMNLNPDRTLTLGEWVSIKTSLKSYSETTGSSEQLKNQPDKKISLKENPLLKGKLNSILEKNGEPVPTNTKGGEFKVDAYFPDHKSYFFWPDSPHFENTLPLKGESASKENLFRSIQLVGTFALQLEETLDQFELSLLNPQLTIEQFQKTENLLIRLKEEISRGRAKLEMGVEKSQNTPGLTDNQKGQLKSLQDRFQIFEKRVENDLRYVQSRSDLIEFVQMKGHYEALSVEKGFK